MKKILLLLTIVSFATACAPTIDNKVEESSSNKEQEKMQTSLEKQAKEADKKRSYDFTLNDLNGEAYTLADQKGKNVYVKFWASWCPVCLAGLEDLNTLAGQENDFEVVTIVSPNHNGEKNKEEFMAWFNSLEYDNMTVLLDETGEVFANYGVRSMPTNAIIDSHGTPVKIIPGEIRKDTLTPIFEALEKGN
ncbi:TlpA family protein disulfide reductase [Facklamia miroungae]|uniref:Peptide methionine sulfoxide reductase msrA/msrB n=1 Tax=Facklamia miroungae TaxID=120956 RepID=A0A1G7T8F1_9LACT|nr:redoxin family protein [Facklamia miroungae]NKZ29703.1 redoxin family protein [Facklamia miroungae]SDG31362.1 peptide methionine sulfoxide reductase msrA/msrB [Facklamia miroungae]